MNIYIFLYIYIVLHKNTFWASRIFQPEQYSVNIVFQKSSREMITALFTYLGEKKKEKLSTQGKGQGYLYLRTLYKLTTSMGAAHKSPWNCAQLRDFYKLFKS